MSTPDWALERAREITSATINRKTDGSYTVPSLSELERTIAAELRKERERAEDTASDLEIWKNSAKKQQQRAEAAEKSGQQAADAYQSLGQASYDALVAKDAEIARLRELLGRAMAVHIEGRYDTNWAVSHDDKSWSAEQFIGWSPFTHTGKRYDTLEALLEAVEKAKEAE
jgi:hypothetical protein